MYIGAVCSNYHNLRIGVIVDKICKNRLGYGLIEGLENPISRIRGLVEKRIYLNLYFPHEFEIFEVILMIVFEIYCLLLAHFVGEMLGELLKA